MVTIEKRKRKRIKVPTEDATIEIENTFGPKRKVVYKVNDFDEYGVSFFVPHRDGYFIPGTPLKFSLVSKHKGRSFLNGIVCYYHPYYNRKGEKFNKIGIEFKKTSKIPRSTSFKLRPIRLSISQDKIDTLICFKINDNIYQFELIDLSKYSAAFSLDKEQCTDIITSSLLKDVRMYCQEHLVFKGEVTVTKTCTDQNNCNRIVIEPRTKPFSLVTISKCNELKNTCLKSSEIMKQNYLYSMINSAFKDKVNSLRIFFEDYETYLNSPTLTAKFDNDKRFLDSVFPEFYSFLDKHILTIDKLLIKLSLSDSDHSLYKEYYQKNLHRFFLKAPIIHRAYYKPEGYPGDFEIMNMIHKNEYLGENNFSRLLHKYTASIPGAQIAASRTKFLEYRILEFYNEKKSDLFKIFSIASGPALELKSLIDHHPEIAEKCSFTLLDQEINALNFSQDSLYLSKIKSEMNCLNINFIHSTIGNYIKENAKNPSKDKFDLCYAFGLFDYFNQDVAKMVIKFILLQIKKGGRIIISNISMDNMNYKYFSEFCMDWYVVYRNKKELEKIVPKSGLIKNYRIFEIEKGMMKFLEINC